MSDSRNTVDPNRIPLKLTMANPEDIERWKKGKQHWNRWASQNRGASVDFSNHEFDNADFRGFSFYGNANFSHSRFKSGVMFQRTAFLGEVTFAKCKFDGPADFHSSRFEQGATFVDVRFSEVTFSHSDISGSVSFNGVCFGGAANFGQAKFSEAGFERAIFHKGATFGSSTFRGRAQFQNSRFDKQAIFESATFEGTLRFSDCTVLDRAKFDSSRFRRSAWFRETSFCGYTSFARVDFGWRTDFRRARFNSKTSFRAANSQGSFSLAEAQFQSVPDFIEISLRAPPRLDNISVADARPYQWSGDRDRAACYRALKRLAIDAHDHTREQQFFANELRERRGSDDRALGNGAARFWFGFAYELLSDFGRSIARPLVWLTVSILFFGIIYGSRPRLPCNWPQDTWITPDLYLSFLNSLPIVGFGRGGQREVALQCLFGAPNAVRPGMDLIFIWQNMWSAVLLFLFLLSIRNHFRIK